MVLGTDKSVQLEVAGGCVDVWGESRSGFRLMPFSPSYSGILTLYNTIFRIVFQFDLFLSEINVYK